MPVTCLDLTVVAMCAMGGLRQKSLLTHPMVTENGGMRVDGVAVRSAEQLFLKAGDAVLFNDHLLHGS